jgi:peptidoglycan hydrolase CwlO-like protein
MQLRNFSARRIAAIASLRHVVPAVALALALAPPAGAVKHTDADDATLGGRIERLGGQVRELQGQIDALQRRESAVQAELDGRLTRQRQIASELVATRRRAARLRSRLAEARRVLARRVVGVYKAGEPDYLTVVLRSDGFSELVERAAFLRRVSEQDRHVIGSVTQLKNEAAGETVRLAALEKEQARLVADVQRRRDTLAAGRGRLAARAAPLQRRLTASRARLAAATRVRDREAGEREPRPRRPAGPNTPTSLTPSGRVTLRSDGLAVAPINAPAAVKAAVAAGNRIAKKPYRYGGGHGSFDDSAYDCSGSVSYVLHAAGVLKAPLPSGPLAAWGKPGPGNWITVYAHPGHTMVSVGGVWFDTSGRGANGSRWQGGSKPTGGYAVRHWPGL